MRLAEPRKSLSAPWGAKGAKGGEVLRSASQRRRLTPDAATRNVPPAMTDPPDSTAPQSPPQAPTPTPPKRARRDRGSLPLYEVLLSDPLGSAARGERRNLLAGSVLVFLVTHVGLVPEKVESLGIDLSSADLRRLGSVFFYVMAYFMVMFIGYAFSDALAKTNELVARWQREIHQEQIARASHAQQGLQPTGRLGGGAGGRSATALFGGSGVTFPTSNDAAQVIAERFPGLPQMRQVSKPAAYIRCALDFVVPLLIGLWAMGTLAGVDLATIAGRTPHPPAHAPSDSSSHR